MKALILLALTTSFLIPQPENAYGHAGGLDGCGCHGGSTRYHCHANPCNYCPDTFDCLGKVRITTIPRGEIWIDGKRIGLSPVTASAQHGQVAVEVRHRLLGVARQTAFVVYGKVTSIEFRW